MYPLRFHLLYSPQHSWGIRLFINSYVPDNVQKWQQQYLHSIMYLLIHMQETPTFPLRIHLHSIMYLLIQIEARFDSTIVEFTFHNVSINSLAAMLTLPDSDYLHSIMYLLIHKRI